MFSKNLFYSGLLITALLLSGWSLFIIYHKKPSTADDLGKPDSFMEEVVATFIDKEGKPSLKMIATKMTHYNQNDATTISNPILTLYRKSPKPWHLTADHARALQGISQIRLWSNVIINHPGDTQNEKTTLLTPSLSVFPDKQVATTVAPVVITQPNTKIHAIGMKADLDSGAIHLLSQAVGEYSVQN